MNDWFKLLLGFKKGHFSNLYNGLTPISIVGACQIPIEKIFESPELVKHVTEQMFNEMKSFDNGEYIVISTDCPIHKGVVMNLSGQIWTDDAINPIFPEVWQRYGSEIINGDYHISTEEKKCRNFF